MRSWTEELGATWLARPPVVVRFDRRVRDELRRHRTPRPSRENVAPWSVEVLAREIEHLGDEQRWLWCTAAVSLLAEILFCAPQGGTFGSMRPRFPYHLGRNIETLRVLRNAVFHPAHQKVDAGSGAPPIEQLIYRLEQDLEGDVAAKLRESWAYLAERAITRFALRILNSAGRLYAEEVGIRVPD